MFPTDDPATLAAQEELADFLNFAARRFDQASCRGNLESSGACTRRRKLRHSSVARYLRGRSDRGQRTKEGERLAQICWEARSKVLGADDINTQVSRQSWGLAQLRLGKFDQAETTRRAAYDTPGVKPGGPTKQFTLVVRINLGYALIGQGRFSNARELAEGGLILARKNHGPSHPIALNF